MPTGKVTLTFYRKVHVFESHFAAGSSFVLEIWAIFMT